MDIQPLNRENAKCKNLTAFTLLELMVVISIIGILTLVAIPNFKKAYEDLNIKKTCGEVEVICNSIQAYYLIMNEFPSDSQPRKVNSGIKWVLPKYFYKNFDFLIEPYSGGNYDIENWFTDDVYATFMLNLRAVRTDLREKLCKTLVNFFYRPCSLEPVHDSIGVWFPEIPIKSEMLKIPKNHRNRFY